MSWKGEKVGTLLPGGGGAKPQRVVVTKRNVVGRCNGLNGGIRKEVDTNC